MAFENFNPPTPCGVGRRKPSWPGGSCIFQSTHPMRGGTFQHGPQALAQVISILPPHAGWDLTRRPADGPVKHFNPPTPCGVGPGRSLCMIRKEEFQSTHPMRGGTNDLRQSLGINIHFNPPTPCGVGPGHAGQRPQSKGISIHPPHAGWDLLGQLGAGIFADFNPPTPCGVGRAEISEIKNRGNFNPPTPCGVGLP